jgi:hypothetical protein
MKAFTEKLHRELLSKLYEFDESYDPLNLADPRLGLITNTIEQIKEKLKTHQFDSVEEEISYFKDVLPSTLSLYLYYSDKIEWDHIIRQGSPECRYKFTDRVYAQIDDARKKHTMFCQYLRDGETYLDNLYFLRTSPVNRERKYQIMRTTDSSTPPLYCEILAMLMAQTKLEYDLKISELKNTASPTVNAPDASGAIWTGSKVSGSELVYALKHSGLINNGNISLNKIQICFEKAFSVKLGNITKQYQEIQSRKMEKNSVIDKLKDGLIKASDDTDREYERKRRS